MLPRFPAGKGIREIGSKRKEKRGKEEFLKGKCNQGHCINWQWRRWLCWHRKGWFQPSMGGEDSLNAFFG